ncbi:MAG: tRNA (5-methylaminomethyl-2-thiouridine)(34)-methyltransferase MnmD, partial [Burkholderiales bacterium]|nr:tRNA (5-methylaminomethyl-2-thiouridine)(34)-methyltransferase MnmD [Burkholderiales bacterium]
MRLDVAQLGEDPSGDKPGVPYSALYDDLYHGEAGAAAQAQYVFLQGNNLPGRWQGRDQFVVLETGFGLGNNFLETWAAWRADPQRCRHLFFVSIEKHPLSLADLRRVHASATPSTLPLAERLIAAWPVLTPGLHTLNFDDAGGQVTLLLGLGDVADVLPSLVMQVDAFYLDGFAPSKNPQMWDEAMLSRLGRLAAPGCTAATWTVARSVRDGLTQAGFAVSRLPGFASKRDMIQAVYAPRHTPAPPPGGYQAAPVAAHRHAIVVGAGLAGCVATWALCREGWQVTLIDQQPGPAQEASGNPGGLFHSIVHGEDGIHARAHRAAALAISALATPWIESGRLAGQSQGLLRLDPKTSPTDAQALIDKLALPADYVQWLDREQALDVAGMDVPSGGWLFKQAGWLHPAGLAQLLLDDARAWANQHGVSLIERFGQKVSRIHKADETGGGAWEVWTEEDTSAQAATSASTLRFEPFRANSLVLTCANQVNALLQTLAPEQAVPPCPLTPIRGQVTTLSPDVSTGRAQLPRLPVAGSGYTLTLPDGRLLCGATTQHHDTCAEVRTADHIHNLGQALRLGALQIVPAEMLDDALNALATDDSTWGKTGWRATTPDRLPLVGALPWTPERLSTLGGRTRTDQT